MKSNKKFTNRQVHIIKKQQQQPCQNPSSHLRALDGAEMGNRPQGLHVKSNSFYPLRPEPEVSKARKSAARGPRAAMRPEMKLQGRRPGVPSAGPQVGLRGPAAALHMPALQRVGKTEDGDARPARTGHGSIYPVPGCGGRGCNPAPAEGRSLSCQAPTPPALPPAAALPRL